MGGEPGEVEGGTGRAADVIRVGSGFPPAAGEEADRAAGQTGDFNGVNKAVNEHPGVVFPSWLGAFGSGHGDGWGGWSSRWGCFLAGWYLRVGGPRGIVLVRRSRHKVVILAFDQHLWGLNCVWHFPTLDSAGFDRQHHDFPYLNTVVWPEAVRLAEGVGLAVVFDRYPSQGILRSHPVKIYQHVPIFRLRGRVRAAIPLIRISSLEASQSIRLDMSIGRQQAFSFLRLDIGKPSLLRPFAEGFPCPAGRPPLRWRSTGCSVVSCGERSPSTVWRMGSDCFNGSVTAAQELRGQPLDRGPGSIPEASGGGG